MCLSYYPNKKIGGKNNETIIKERNYRLINRSKTVADFNITPDVAIVDTNLVQSMTPTLIADTGMDALTHAFEAYVSTASNSITDALAMKSIEMTVDYLIDSFKGDQQARKEMHISQSLAGMAFSNAILGIVHYLQISEEKSKVVNLKKNSSEFLGFRLKAHRKRTNKRTLYVARSHMTKKALNNAQIKVKQAIKAIQKHQSVENVWRFNTVIMGIQNYYSAASHITDDLNELNYRLHKALYNRLKEIKKKQRSKTSQNPYRNGIRDMNVSSIK